MALAQDVTWSEKLFVARSLEDSLHTRIRKDEGGRPFPLPSPSQEYTSKLCLCAWFSVSAILHECETNHVINVVFAFVFPFGQVSPSRRLGIHEDLTRSSLIWG
jgi:hypothetical protein